MVRARVRISSHLLPVRDFLLQHVELMQLLANIANILCTYLMQQSVSCQLTLSRIAFCISFGDPISGLYRLFVCLFGVFTTHVHTTYVLIEVRVGGILSKMSARVGYSQDRLFVSCVCVCCVQFSEKSEGGQEAMTYCMGAMVGAIVMCVALHFGP